ncbi:MAG: type IV toxin-antitoxin system AbiEi family antitoxin domain-containing protein [Candidatus Micrarchaeales archaeon]
MKLTTKLLNYIDDAKIAEFPILQGLSLTSKGSLTVTLNKLARAGSIYNPLKGIYVSKKVDPFSIATTLYPGYISLTSSFYLHNLMDEYPFTVFVASEKRKQLSMGQYEFHYFKAKNYGGVENGTYNVASIEKAIYDSMLHSNLVGYPRLSRALYYSRIDSEKLLGICKREGNAFFQRLGYLLSILPSRSREKNKVMEFCLKKVSANAYLEGRGSGKYISRWRIIDNVGKEALLSWWHQ